MVRLSVLILFSLQILLFGGLTCRAAESVDTVKLRAALKRTDHLISTGAYDLAFQLADSLYAVAKKAGLANTQGLALNRMGVVLRCKGDLSHSLIILNQSLGIADSLHNQDLISNNYNNIGAVNRMLGNYPLALRCYLKSLKIKDELHDLDGMAAVLNNIGIVYLYQEDYDKALDYYGRSQVISQKIKDIPGQAISYINIGEAYQKKGNNSDAIVFYMKGLELSEQIGDRDNQAVISNELGNIYKSKGDCSYAYEFYAKSLLVFEQLKDNYRIAQVLTNLGSCCIELNRKEEGHRLLLRALSLSKAIGSWELIRDVSAELSQYYQKNGNYKQALTYHQGYTAARDSSFSKEKTEQLIRAQMRFDFEKEQHNIEVEQEKRSVIAGEKSRWQLAIRVMLSIIVVVLLALLAVLYRNYRNKQLLFVKLEEHQNEILEKNEELMQQQEEILAQRDEIEHANEVLKERQRQIEQQNERIMSSLEYAKTIQEAILPEDHVFSAIFRDYFILYQPKDVVSGDFYWTYKTNECTLFALADCTGHGVAGGFMSMIGNTLLNQIVVESEITDPALVLEKLNIMVREALKQDADSPHSHSGMDIAIVLYDKLEGTLTFSGAKRPLYMFKGNEFIKIAGDSRSIGGYQLEATRKFTLNKITLDEPTVVYLFSDGFSDQLNEDDRKFGVATLKSLLSEIYRLPMAKQKQRLLMAHQAHKGGREQIDDITMIGFAI
ncbi:tetratricopeptide repeat protein [Williamwhitmania taraxaci]|nr:tetratricopeptide repeat protein [Williamwhitmania taraxaci]